MLITGAAGGIGAACARRLAADGARLLLADLARHIAEAHAQQDSGVDAEDFIEQIRAGFESEMDAPSDPVSGSIQ